MKSRQALNSQSSCLSVFLEAEELEVCVSVPSSRARGWALLAPGWVFVIKTAEVRFP